MNIEDVLKLVRPNILGLEAYSTARDDCGSNQPEIFLDANENPYNNGINRYPDPHQKALKAKVAEIKGFLRIACSSATGATRRLTLFTVCSAYRGQAMPCPSLRVTGCTRWQPR